ncbi:MAG: type II toxin-antitoxin system VapC family toxin [Bacteroidia bacterium]
MSYLLDTNVCIYLIKHQPPQVKTRFEQVPIGEIGISSITLAELRYGAAKSQAPSRNQQALQQFTSVLAVHALDDAAAVVYGHIRASLEQKGTPIGPLDTLIAAHALSMGMVLVTNNLKEFERVPGLLLENWV